MATPVRAMAAAPPTPPMTPTATFLPVGHSPGASVPVVVGNGDGVVVIVKVPKEMTVVGGGVVVGRCIAYRNWSWLTSLGSRCIESSNQLSVCAIRSLSSACPWHCPTNSEKPKSNLTASLIVPSLLLSDLSTD